MLFLITIRDQLGVYVTVVLALRKTKPNEGDVRAMRAMRRPSLLRNAERVTG